MASPRTPLILLPPSEGKAAGGRGSWDPASGTFGALAEARCAVAGALAAAVDGAPASVERLLGVSGPHLERAVDADRRVVGAPVLPAAKRYTGVVHAHLGVATLPAAARARARSTIVTVSGLLGAVAPGDPVPDYRLKMGATLPPLGRLARWWAPRLIDALEPVAAGRPVLDLLPAEHAAAYQPDGVARSVIRVRFERQTGTGSEVVRTVVGHDAKAAKGLLARHVLTSSGRLVDRVITFEALGWHLDDDASDVSARTGGTAVFIRSLP